MGTIEHSQQRAQATRRSAIAQLGAEVMQTLAEARAQRRALVGVRARQGAALMLVLRQGALARRQRVATVLAEMEQRRHEAGAALRSTLAAADAERRVAVAQTLAAIGTARHERAAAQCQQRAASVARLRESADVTLEQLHEARIQSAGAQRQQPTSDRASLAPTSPVVAIRHAQPAPLAESLVSVLRSANEAPIALVATAPALAPASDDFTAIWGVGPATQQRLNRAGIYTYAQLAQSAPSTLRRAMGDTMRLNNVEQWIEQARDLAALN